MNEVRTKEANFVTKKGSEESSTRRVEFEGRKSHSGLITQKGSVGQENSSVMNRGVL